jgi:hypothetical protein
METPLDRTPSKEALVIMVSGTCCVPQLAVVDQQAQQIIQQAMAETGIQAQVKTLKVSSALNGGIPMEIIKSMGVGIDVANIMRLPAVFIDNHFISFGVPNLDAIKDGLRNTQS